MLLKKYPAADGSFNPTQRLSSEQIHHPFLADKRIFRQHSCEQKRTSVWWGDEHCGLAKATSQLSVYPSVLIILRNLPITEGSHQPSEVWIRTAWPLSRPLDHLFSLWANKLTDYSDTLPKTNREKKPQCRTWVLLWIMQVQSRNVSSSDQPKESMAFTVVWKVFII